jgi:hypothetical protein
MKVAAPRFLRASKFPFENALLDVTHGLEVREREFAVLDVPANPVAPAATTVPVTRLADGFFPPAAAWSMRRASSISSIISSSASTAGARPKG